MATPVVQRMLKSQEWWHVAENAEPGKAKKKPTTTVKEDPAVKEARLSDNIYHHMMLRLGDQELAKLQAETKAANAAEQELRAQRDAAVIRAEAHNLLVHSPDAWWDAFPNANTPTAMVVLTVDNAACLQRMLRRLLKSARDAHQREHAIDALLVEVQVALDFESRRRSQGPGTALKIQRLAHAYLARKKVRAIILGRWEKRWRQKEQCFVFVDTVAERAELRSSMGGGGGGFGGKQRPFVKPPWLVESKYPPDVLRKRQFNPVDAYRGNLQLATIGSPRSTERKSAKEQSRGDGVLAEERLIRPISQAAVTKRDALIHDLCSLGGVMEAMGSAARALSEQWPSPSSTNENKGPIASRFAPPPSTPSQRKAIEIATKAFEAAEAEWRAEQIELQGDDFDEAGGEQRPSGPAPEAILKAWKELKEEQDDGEAEVAEKLQEDKHRDREWAWCLRQGIDPVANAAAIAADNGSGVSVPHLDSEEPVNCQFTVKVLPPWPSPRSSTAAQALQRCNADHDAMKQADLEAVKAVVKRKRGVTRNKNAPEESQDPSELFGGWGAPAALKDLAAVQTEAAEEEEAERAAMYESNENEVDEATAEREAEARATSAQRKDWEAACSACTNGDPPTLSAFLEGIEAEAAAAAEIEEEEAALAHGREMRSSNDQVHSWRTHQKDLLTCSNAADAMKVLLRDAGNFLGALAAGQRIANNSRAWPHRALFPVPLLLHKHVPCLDSGASLPPRPLPESSGDGAAVPANVLAALERSLPEAGEQQGSQSGAAAASSSGSGAAANSTPAKAKAATAASSSSKDLSSKAVVEWAAECACRGPAPSFRALLVSKSTRASRSSRSSKTAVDLRAVAVRGCGGSCAAPAILLEGGLAKPAIPATLEWLENNTSAIQRAFKSLHEPLLPSEYAQAHEFLVSKKKRQPDDVDASMELLEDMGDQRREQRNAEADARGDKRLPLKLPLLAFCATGTNAKDRYAAAEVVAPFTLARWGMRQHAARFEKTEAVGSAKANRLVTHNSSSSNSGSRSGTPSNEGLVVDDPESPQAIERSHLADSVAVDVVVDPLVRQQVRESAFEAIGDLDKCEFAEPDKEVFLTRLRFFKVDNIPDLGPPPKARDLEAESQAAKQARKAQREAERQRAMDMKAGRRPSIMPSQQNTEMGATAASANQSVSSDAKDQWGAKSPILAEQGDALTYGVEHGAPAPRLPLTPPPLALFDWRQPEDAALLLGGSAVAQARYLAEDPEDVKLGWEPHLPNVAASPHHSAIAAGATSMKKTSTRNTNLTIPPAPFVVPNPNQPSIFAFKDLSPAGFLVELRLRGKGLDTKGLRPILAHNLHGLLVSDGSENLLSGSEANPRAGTADKKKKGKRRK